jgi:hypothetical protein
MDCKNSISKGTPMDGSSPMDFGEDLPKWKKDLFQDCLRRFHEGEPSRDAYEVIAELRKKYNLDMGTDGLTLSEQQLEMLQERRRIIDEGNAEYCDWEEALSEIRNRPRAASDDCRKEIDLTPQQQALLRERLKRFKDGKEELSDLDAAVDEVNRELDSRK